MEATTLAIAICSAIASIATVIVAALALNRTTQIARTHLFVDLRRSHAETYAKMDPRYRDAKWDPRKDPEAMRTLERYWLHTLTEWFATQKLNAGAFSDVWKDFYEKAIAGGLRNKPLRISLWEMLYGQPGSTFSGFRQEFGTTIESLYKREYKQELRDSI